MRRPIHFVTVAVCATSSVLATCAAASAAGARAANGIGSLPAARVLERSAQALAEVRNLVVDGSLTFGPEAIAFDVRSSGRGSRVAGTLSIRSGASSVGPVAFVDTPAALYLRAGSSFWKQEISGGKNPPTATVAATAVAKLADRWIEVTGAEAASFSTSFGELTEPGKFAQSLLKGNGALAKGAPRTIRGIAVLPITTGDGATIFVALDGAPVPVEIAGSSAVGSSSVSVTAVIEAPRRLTITTPAGAETLASLAGSLGG